MSGLGDLDDIIELGIEGFDKITDKGFDHLPDDAMHANFYHPRRLKSLKNLGRSKKNKDPSPQAGAGSRGVDNGSDQPRGDYQSRAPQDYGSRPQPPYPDSDYDTRPRAGTSANPNYDARPQARGPPDPIYDVPFRSRNTPDPGYDAAPQFRGPPPAYIPAAAAAAGPPPPNFRPNLYRPPSGYIDPPSPYASSSSDSDAREKPRRRKKHRRRHRHHRHHRGDRDTDPRYRSVSPSGPSASFRPGPPIRRASSLDAFDRPPQRSPSPSPPPLHHHALADLRRDGKRPFQSQWFSQSTQALGASALGAIAGGLVAKEVQTISGTKMPGAGHSSGLQIHPKGKDKKGARQGGHSWMVTLIGAGAGALGANALMERREERDRKVREHQEYQDSRRGSWGHEGSAIGSGSGKGKGGKRGMTTGVREVDDYEEDDYDRRKSFGNGFDKGESRW